MISLCTQPIRQNITVQSDQVSVQRDNTVSVKLAERLGPNDFDRQFYILIPHGAFRSGNSSWRGIHRPEEDSTSIESNSWSFRTEHDVAIPAGTVTTNKSSTPQMLEVWGVGIFVNDIGTCAVITSCDRCAH